MIYNAKVIIYFTKYEIKLSTFRQTSFIISRNITKLFIYLAKPVPRYADTTFTLSPAFFVMPTAFLSHNYLFLKHKIKYIWYFTKYYFTLHKIINEIVIKGQGKNLKK